MHECQRHRDSDGISLYSQITQTLQVEVFGAVIFFLSPVAVLWGLLDWSFSRNPTNVNNSTAESSDWQKI